MAKTLDPLRSQVPLLSLTGVVGGLEVSSCTSLVNKRSLPAGFLTLFSCMILIFDYYLIVSSPVILFIHVKYCLLGGTTFLVALIF